MRRRCRGSQPSQASRCRYRRRYRRRRRRGVAISVAEASLIGVAAASPLQASWRRMAGEASLRRRSGVARRGIVRRRSGIGEGAEGLKVGGGAGGNGGEWRRGGELG
jgi:hypothetical protein